MGSATVPLPLAKESNFGGPMKKRGRPKTNGGKPPWVLRRITLVVYAYDRARKAGEKHEAAVDEAVKFVRTRKAKMPISGTEVKRILADWRPSRKPRVLLVSKSDPKECIRLPDGRVFRRTFTAAVGPRPFYPRANAAVNPRKRVKAK
jgi:hypothetical protein